MKKFLLSGVSVAALSIASYAVAADATAEKPAVSVAQAPVGSPYRYVWSGFYFGAQGGLSASALNIGPIDVEDGLFTNVRSNLIQTNVGLHAGYDWQFDRIVAGLEGDINFKLGEGPFAPTKLRTQSDWDTSLRVRLGMLLAPNALIYATGGVAFGSFSSETSINPNEPSSDVLGEDRFGWTLGAGFQYALDSKWSTRIEYRHTGWGSTTVTFNNDPDFRPPERASSRLSDNRISFGLTYRLGGPADPGFGGSDVGMTVPGWTGFYIGGQAGFDSGNMRAVTDNGQDTGYGSFTQVLAGGHAGYNYQLNASVVAGVEGDYSRKFGGGWLAAANSRPTSSWDASVRARLGLLATPQSLVYATAGFAFGRFTTPLHEFDPSDEVELLGKNRTGWTVGTGVQYALDGNWSSRLEFRHTDWGTKSVDWEGRSTRSRLTDDRLLAGLSYKLGAPARFGERDSIAVDWTGLYAGTQIGGSAAKSTYGLGRTGIDEDSADEYADFTQALLGGFAGYNYQLAGAFVVGGEADMNAKMGHGFKFDDLLRPTSQWDGSVRLRVGFAATARGLIYATGGFAFGHFSTPQSGAQEPNDPPEEHIGGMRVGWTIGGGIQYALDNNWSTRIEYRHTGWGTKTLTNITDTSCGDGCPETVRSKLLDDRIALGVAYRF